MATCYTYDLLGTETGDVVLDPASGMPLAFNQVLEPARTPFDTAWLAAEPDLDLVMAESFAMVPRKAQADVNAPHVDDASRVELVFDGIWCEVSQDVRPRGRTGGSAGPWNGTEPMIDVRVTAFGDRPKPRRDDIIERLATCEKYRVDSAEPGDLGRIFIRLTRVAS